MHLVSPLAQNWGQRLDSQGRERHHFDPVVVRIRVVQGGRQYSAEVIIAHVNQEHIHLNGSFGQVDARKLTAMPSHRKRFYLRLIR
jgi:hypothetical protein